jgi:hypothetical protein
MQIPSFEEYCLMNPRQRKLVRQEQRRQGVELYHMRIGQTSPLLGRSRPDLKGPKPPRPHLWRTGPDPVRHRQYDCWSKHRAQSHFRGEEFSLTFEEYESIWADQWPNRGRKSWSMVMTRIDLEKGWHRDNVVIMERLQHLRRVGQQRKLRID